MENKLTSRPDDYTFNVTYVQSRSVGDLCQMTAARLGTKYSASEIESIYDALKDIAKEEVCSGSVVEFGFTTNSVGVDGSFIGPKAQFDPKRNKLALRTVPTAEARAMLTDISVIVSHVEEGLPTIITVTDVTTGEVNVRLTPGGGLNGTGKRTKIMGEEGKTVGFFFVNAESDEETLVPPTALMRNDPSHFSFIIPDLPDGTYYLEVATQCSSNNRTLLKEPRRNRFPYLLTVGDASGDPSTPGEI